MWVADFGIARGRGVTQADAMSDLWRNVVVIYSREQLEGMCKTKVTCMLYREKHQGGFDRYEIPMNIEN